MKTYEVTAPDGTRSVISNLTQFCETHGLLQAAMWRVAKGKQLQHKGWLCKELAYENPVDDEPAV